MNKMQGAALYSKMNHENSVTNANRHKLIDLLLTGAIDNIVSAIDYISNNKTEKKCMHLSKAFNIIDGLRLSLDLKNGGEIAENLDQLYEYIQNQIIDANLNNKTELLEEVKGLLNTILSGWQGIEDQFN